MKGRLVKILFELDPGSADGHGSETLWAEQIASDRYRLRNSPFYAYGVSADDVVFAESYRVVNGASAVDSEVARHGSGAPLLSFQGVSIRGGHSTYRIMKDASTSQDRFTREWIALETLGCTYEQAQPNLFAVDVPPHTNIHEAYSILEKGESNGVWAFEEGHCGHSTVQDSSDRAD